MAGKIRNSRRNHSGSPKGRAVRRRGKAEQLTTFRATALRRIPITGPSGATGRLKDLVVTIAEDGSAHVQDLVVLGKGKPLRVSAKAVADCGIAKLQISEISPSPTPFKQANGEILLFDDLLDGEVIDRGALRVVRVNDVLLSWDGKGLNCAAVDTGPAGLARRLLPAFLSDRMPEISVPWSDVEPVIEPPAGLDFKLRYSNLENLYPADVGRLIDHVSFRQAGRILSSLDPQFAADALEEVQKERQAEILEYMPRENAIAILNGMAPDAAADLLENVPREKSDALIGALQPGVAEDIRLLLSYPHSSAAGLMTTEFVMARHSEVVSDALEHVRKQLRRPNLVYYVYVVNNSRERKLEGVMSLRDLLLAEPDARLADCMESGVHVVHPQEHCKEVARIMGEYNLLALPVVDDDGRMLGLVTADDVLDLMLPENLRRSLPRLFS